MQATTAAATTSARPTSSSPTPPHRWVRAARSLIPSAEEKHCLLFILFGYYALFALNALYALTVHNILTG